ncbi:VOC family protein [Kiloniella antarctica]|uniref:VOC family protein n=1 Tax=Kiloniella antarctica TaxID=1550907 RepID=A0ABW5BJ90_9PROT
MQLAYTILYVENVMKTLEFYQVAFGFEQKMLHESGDYGELDTGATTLSFSSHTLMEQIGKNPGRPTDGKPCFEIAFTTDDVPVALSTAVRAGATLVQEAQDMPWGQTTAYVTDLNGFLVELCSPI